MNNVRKVAVHHRTAEGQSIIDESFAAETLILLVVNGSSLTSLLGSPQDAKELAVGHLLTQHGLGPQHIESIDVSERDGAVHVDIATKEEQDLTERTGVVTTSCGACDQSELNELVKGAPVVTNPSLMFELEAVIEMLHAMRDQQTGFHLTGGMHAAGLYAADATSLVVMEDIGRHNAVDKVIGVGTAKKLDFENLFERKCN